MALDGTLTVGNADMGRIVVDQQEKLFAGRQPRLSRKICQRQPLKASKREIYERLTYLSRLQKGQPFKAAAGRVLRSKSPTQLSAAHMRARLSFSRLLIRLKLEKWWQPSRWQRWSACNRFRRKIVWVFWGDFGFWIDDTGYFLTRYWIRWKLVEIVFAPSCLSWKDKLGQITSSLRQETLYFDHHDNRGFQNNKYVSVLIWLCFKPPQYPRCWW